MTAADRVRAMEIEELERMYYWTELQAEADTTPKPEPKVSEFSRAEIWAFRSFVALLGLGLVAVIVRML